MYKSRQQLSINLRESVLNYRHPSPRRGWKGGSERRLRDHIVKIRGNPGDPQMCPKVGFY